MVSFIFFRHIKYFLCFLLLLFFAPLAAQQIEVSVPSYGYTNTPIQISFTTSEKINKAPEPSSLNKLNVIAGPNFSTFSSITSINGKTTKKESVTIHYTILAKQKGTYTIPPLQFHTESGKLLQSTSKTITIVNNQTQASPLKQDKASFMIASVNKTSLYENEQLTLNYDLYTRKQLADITGKPNFEDIIAERIPNSNVLYPKVKEYNGTLYQSVNYAQYILTFPKSGKYTIPATNFILSINDIVYEDPTDPFSYSEKISKDIKATTKPIYINVLSLPTDNKPKSFIDAVGQFSIKSTASTQKIKANESFSLNIKLAGIGNLKLLTFPTASFPTTFDASPLDTKEDINITEKGFSGSITKNFLITPHSMGDFTLPPITFSYFDPTQKKYVTLHTAPIPIKVFPEDKSKSSLQSKALTPIKLGEGDNYHYTKVLYFNKALTILHILFLLLFIILLIFIKSKNKFLTIFYNKNKAYHKALKQLDKLSKQKELNNTQYYKALEQILFTYFSDEFNFILSETTTEKIINLCHHKNLDIQWEKRLLSALTLSQQVIYGGQRSQNERITDAQEIKEILQHLNQHFNS